MKACKQHISERLFFFNWFEKLVRKNVNVQTDSITPEVRVHFGVCSNASTFFALYIHQSIVHRRIHS